jgi:nucleotide-binding universal stress UspA family protein
MNLPTLPKLLMHTADLPQTAREPFARYLVAVDASRAADQAARLAVRFAQGHGAELVFCHAINVHQMLVHADRTFDDFPLVLAAARETARATLDRCCALADNAGVFARSYVREGKPAEEVAALAGALGADLVVIGNSSHAKIHRVLNGSTRDDILRTSRFPVLIAAGEAVPAAETGLRSILALSDGSRHANGATQLAGTIARAYASRLVFVSVGHDGWELALDRAVREYHPGMIVVGPAQRPTWRDPFPENPVACALQDARVPVLVTTEQPAS